ncbi:hypothetical protein FRB95_000103 [Tulasnella sp. JGI-2019a]|nr:hypothetical protein FRB95_000103 [Tulasnella sp. JGI-2019a]
MSLPPLQWLNLRQLWTGGGAQPPPLRDAHISYDPNKRVIIVFGGESAAGNPTQQTYIFQMDDMTWRTPVPPDAQQGIPPARSAGAFGLDSASNYREGLLVWGGKGGTGSTPLDDLWYYHFQNEFWTTIPINSSTNPLARWGTASGTAPESSIQNVETFLWIAGGVNATDAFPLGEVWQLDINGVIAAGSNAASGSWSKVLNNAQSAGIPQRARYGAAGTAIPPVGNANREGTLVVFGGCDVSSATNYNASCGQNDAEILTLPTDPSQITAQWTIAADCPPGSYAASMGPNRNTAAATFSSQVFLFPAAIDTSLWNDTASAVNGEIAVLESTSGVWARVLPAEDPNSTPGRPTPKEGAVIYSYTNSITGRAGSWSDTIIFGGKDVTTGQLTNEMWILRAYNDAVQSSSQHWGGYGNGVLQSGINATGTGVTTQFLSSCAERLSPISSTTTTSQPSAGPTSLPTPVSVPKDSQSLLDHSPVNQYLSPLSIGLLLAAILLFRASSCSCVTPLLTRTASRFCSMSGLMLVSAYATGIAGFALGAKESTRQQIATSRRRSVNASTSGSFVSTAHGKVALVLFIVLYVLIPVWGIVLVLTRRRAPRLPESSETRPSLQDHRKDTDETAIVASGSAAAAEKERHTENSEDSSAILLHEKNNGRASRDRSPPPAEEDEGEEFPIGGRARSSRTSGLFSNPISSYRPPKQSQTAASPAASSTAPPSPEITPKFEVVNRPTRTSLHQASQPSLFAGTHMSRNPSDISWLAKRRSIGLYGQLDYELSHRNNGTAKVPSPRPQSDLQPTTTPIPAQTPPTMPKRMLRLWFNVALQVVVLWALLFWLVTFSLIHSTPGLAVMAVCLVVFYTGMIGLAWAKRPDHSILVVLVTRLRGDSATSPTAYQPAAVSAHRPTHSNQPSGSNHPYLHSPAFRAVPGGDDDIFSRSTHGARSMDSDGADDDEEDDDARQARIEEEMARRDVSIFTVPKRRLVVRN